MTCLVFCCPSAVPTPKQLTNIVVPKLAADWKTASINLDFELSTIRIIQQKCGRDDPESCCFEMLAEWLTTGEMETPKTWNTLLSALKTSKKLTNVCNEIERKLTEGICIDLSSYFVTVS